MISLLDRYLYGHVSIFLSSWGIAWTTAIYIFGVVTFIFMTIERSPGSKQPPLEPLGSTRWDPRRLPAPDGTQPIARSSSILSFLVNTTFLLALLDVPHFRYIPVTFTSAWIAAYVCTVVAAAFTSLADIAAFVNPNITAVREWIRLGSSVLIMTGFGIMLSPGPLIASAADAQTNVALNALAFYILVGGIVVLGIQAAVSARLLFKKWPQIRATEVLS
jgi:hypothetical protein